MRLSDRASDGRRSPAFQRRATRRALARGLPLAGWLAFLVGSADAQTPGGSPEALTRASVDAGLYRDGEVQRRNEVHGRWALDCDEIVRLRQRYCSLRTLALEADGRPAARITISTDEAGKPAALVDVPLAVDLRAPIALTSDQALVVGQPSKELLRASPDEVTSSRRSRKGAGPAPAITATRTEFLTADLHPDICDRSGCHAVWPLTPGDIAALRAGAGIRLRFRMAATADASPSARLVEGRASSEGFGDALIASVR